jgi:hypothetical protein
VFTTAEVLLGELPRNTLFRVLDPRTGFPELVVASPKPVKEEEEEEEEELRQAPQQRRHLAGATAAASTSSSTPLLLRLCALLLSPGRVLAAAAARVSRRVGTAARRARAGGGSHAPTGTHARVDVEQGGDSAKGARCGVEEGPGAARLRVLRENIIIPDRRHSSSTPSPPQSVTPPPSFPGGGAAAAAAAAAAPLSLLQQPRTFSPSAPQAPSATTLKREDRMKFKFRTEMCRHLLKSGQCSYGDKCMFAHTRDELQLRSTNASQASAEMCRHFIESGHCLYGSRCMFAHTRDELQLRSTNASQASLRTPLTSV